MQRMDISAAHQPMLDFGEIFGLNSIFAPPFVGFASAENTAHFASFWYRLELRNTWQLQRHVLSLGYKLVWGGLILAEEIWELPQ